MTYNQPYKLAKTIILYAMYKVVFWVTLLWMNVSFGQFYVSDSTVLQIEGTAFESTDKAMILPRIKAPHLNVKSPYPGMMCYDTETQSVALFDGRFWNYWR